MKSNIYEGKYIERVKSVVLEHFAGLNIKIILFGSRARGDNNNRSDIDIGLLPAGDSAVVSKFELCEKIDALNIPYKVDIIDLSTVSGTFRQQAFKDSILWKDYN